MEEKLTHFDEKGNAIMVDVTEKKITSRTATASGKIHVNEAVMKAVLEGTVAKGDVLGHFFQSMVKASVIRIYWGAMS